MKPYLADPDVQIFCGDALETLRELPDRSVHMCCTSPPFYGLRDYGTGTWEGGDEGCDHMPEAPDPILYDNGQGQSYTSNNQNWNKKGRQYQGNECPKCGARRIDRQIGLEESPDEWVARLVEVFREVRRVLRDDGTCFIEIGDSYVSSSVRRDARASDTPYTAPEDSPDPGSSYPDLCGECGGVQLLRSSHNDRPLVESDERDGETSPDTGQSPLSSQPSGPPGAQASTTHSDAGARQEESFESGEGSPLETQTQPPPSGGDAQASAHTRACTCGTVPTQPSSADRSPDMESSALACARSIPIASRLPAKSLLGQPWRLAFALQNDGWILRSEVIFARPNPMPESVTDRPTKSHSTVFLLSKMPRYYFDAEAIREPLAPGAKIVQGGWDGQSGGLHNGRAEGKRDGGMTHPNGANARSVWTIPTQPTPFAHFATWPEALCRRMILAGTSERGVCPECGAPWVREVEAQGYTKHRPSAGNDPRSRSEDKQAEGSLGGHHGWKGNNLLKNTPLTVGWRPSCDHDLEPVPATCLDVFGGSGTTALVARKLGRRAILIELNEDYAKIAADRLSQQSLFATEGAG